MKKVTYDGDEYVVDSSKAVKSIGDIDENNKIIYIDKEIPEKFHEGIAIHEIVERELMKKGHTYVYSHNIANKKEIEFYEKIYGKDQGAKTLEEEEELVLKISNVKIIKRIKKKIKPSKEEAVKIEMNSVWEFIFNGKKYIIDNSNRLIGTLVDFYETKNRIYIDKDVPEKFFKGLAYYEIEERKLLIQGLTWEQAGEEASKKELAFYEAEFGKEEAKKLMEEELELQRKHYMREQELLKEENGHKVVYEKGEILTK